MIITRVLNNNTIVSLDQSDEEIVIKGKGIAFGKKSGDPVDEEKVEKIFRLDTKETIRQYQEIIMDIPDDIIEVTERIIEDLKKKTTKKINDKIYITLTDHISNFLERTALGIQFDSSLLWNVQALYPEEYQLATEAVNTIAHHFDLKVPREEANFIAVHIVNSEMDVEFQETVGITNTITEMMQLIEAKFPIIALESGSLDYARFVLHLRFLLQRMIQNGTLHYDKSSHMVALLLKEYPKQAEVVSQIIDLLTKKYQKEIEGERLFLLIHIVRLTTKDNRMTINN
ncbi:MAG: PRD domain-containing protein [Enterococcus lemanii]|jgi:beta-glucoside operon transcriptional antiterminator